MNNNNRPPISTESIQKKLLEDSCSFIDQIVKNRAYLYPEPDAAKFWRNFRTVVNERKFSTDELCSKCCSFLSKAHLFYDLYCLYEKNTKEQFELLLSLSPSTNALIKALTLVLEIGDLFEKPDITPGYSFSALKSMKSILKDYQTRKTSAIDSEYSLELYNCVKQLLALKFDWETLHDFINAYETDNFTLVQLDNNQGYELIPTEGIPNEDNQYILERLKTDIKQNFKKQEAQEGISGEEHFKSIDPKYNTDKGFATIAVTGATLVSELPEGVTELKLDECISDKMSSLDPLIQQQGYAESFTTFREQHFHYNYRHAMAEAYIPNDILNIHEYTIKGKDELTHTLYDVFCLTSCIVAIADNCRCYSMFPGRRGIADAIPAIIEDLKSSNPGIDEEGLKKETTSIIVGGFYVIEEKCNPFVILTKDEIIIQLRRITELNKKTDEELSSILDTLTDTGNSLAYSPIYKLGDKYIFLYKSCLAVNFNRMVYDYFISKNLFKPGSKTNIKDSSLTNDRYREKEFCGAISRCLKPLTTKSITNVKFPMQHEPHYPGFDGEFDVLSYFEKENIFLSIQVKLSNTFKENEKKRAEWIDAHIWAKAANQIQKDWDFLKNEIGLQFACEKLGLEKVPDNPRIYHLIVTDNFYVDHEEICKNEGTAKGLCISFFEFYNLFSNIRVHHTQKTWENVIEKGSIKYFLELICQNVFWSFLKQIAEGYKTDEVLKLVLKQNSIRLKI